MQLMQHWTLRNGCVSAVTVLAISLVSHSAQAGTITANYVSGGTGVARVSSGNIVHDYVPGQQVVLDVTLTLDPGDTPIGGVGAVWEFSFEGTGGALTIGPALIPTGWFPLPTGPCAGLFCSNYAVAGDLFGTGQTFGPGDSFTFATITVDTIGLPPGIYSFGPTLDGPGDGIRANNFFGEVTSEYQVVPIHSRHDHARARHRRPPRPGSLAARPSL